MKISFKILIPTIIMLLLAVSIVSFIGYSNIAKEMNNVMKVTNESTLNDIMVKIKNAGEQKESLKSSLNNNFLRIARAISKLIEEAPDVLQTEVMQEIAEEVGVDEIHVIGSDGVLYAGSVPGFFGFDLSTNEQTKPFLKMLTDKNFELAQDSQFRAVDNVLFQYIGVPIKTQSGLVPGIFYFYHNIVES